MKKRWQYKSRWSKTEWYRALNHCTTNMDNMRASIICIVAVASMACGAPLGIDEKSLTAPLAPQLPIAPVLPVTAGSAAHHETAFDKGAHQSAASSGQGSFGYDQGGQALKNFGLKESSGSKENYAYSANNAYDQGAGSFSNSGSFSNVANLASALGQHFQHGGLGGLVPGVAPQPPVAPGLAPPVVPGVLPGFPQIPLVPIPVTSSYVGSHQQGLLAAGHAQGQGAWSHNRGQSSVNSSGSKQTFTDKQTFGQEHATGHATGAGQNAHVQSSQAGNHDQGHTLTAVNHGTLLDPRWTAAD